LKHIKMPRKICTLLTQKLETHHKEKCNGFILEKISKQPAQLQ
jgi:hypothetical protein